MSALSLSEFDKIAAVLSLYVAVSSFLIAIVALFVTAILFFSAARHNRKARELERSQHDFQNAINLVGIIAGTRELDPHGKPKEFMQIAAFAALKNYPDMLPVLRFIEGHYLHSGAEISPAYLSAVREAIQHVERLGK